MAQTVIFAEQTLEGFSTDAGFGYSYIQAPPTFSLVAGETYNVLWGDTTYTGLTAYEAEIDGYACVYVGDGSELGYPGNGEMFAIISFDGYNLFTSYADSANSRAVAIYQAEEGTEENPTDTSIVLKNYSGEDVVYETDVVRFLTADGGTQTFVASEIAEGLEINLDFTNGEDQLVSAPDGYLVKSAVIKKPDALKPDNVRFNENMCGVVGSFIGDTEEVTVDLNMADGDQVIVPSADGKVLSKVTITKPDTLIPANIAEGVEIGGVIGALATGGGSGMAAVGIIQGASCSSAQTITHGLGVVPDMIIVESVMNTNGTTGTTRGLLGFSRAFANRHSPTELVYRPSRATTKYNTSVERRLYNNPFMEENTSPTSGYLFNVNSETFSIPIMDTAPKYIWIAIGGLP